MASGPSRPARTKGWHGYPWSFREQGASGAIRRRWTERISSEWVLSPLPPLPCDAALSTECTVCCSLYFSFLWNHFFLWLGNSRDYWTNRSGWRERRAGNWFWHALQAWRHWILEYWKSNVKVCFIISTGSSWSCWWYWSSRSEWAAGQSNTDDTLPIRRQYNTLLKKCNVEYIILGGLANSLFSDKYDCAFHVRVIQGQLVKKDLLDQKVTRSVTSFLNSI